MERRMERGVQQWVYGYGEGELRAAVCLPAHHASGASSSSAPERADNHQTGAIIDVHGGAWYRGDNRQGQHYCAELARRGWLVVAPEFRDASLGGQHPDACKDISACVRYLRTHASQLGIEPSQINLVGSSSGGHLAMLSALLADSDELAGTLLNTQLPGTAPQFAQSAISAAVNAVVALWPVADPAYRYSYAKANDRPELVAGHDAYFGSEAAMRQASVTRVVAAGEASQLPPLFVVQAGTDINVPPEILDALEQAWRGQDGLVQRSFYPGMPHGFACRPGGLTARCIQDIHGFLQACLIPRQPKPPKPEESKPTNNRNKP